MNVGNNAIEHAYNKGYRVDKTGKAFHNGKPIKTDTDKSGRYRFRVRDERNMLVNIPIHRITAYQKFGSVIFNTDIQVRHLDNDFKNNKWENIGIGTASENMMDIPEKIRKSNAIRASSFLCKKVMANGICFNSYREAGRHFGISDNGIRKRIKLGWLGYKHLNES